MNRTSIEWTDSTWNPLRGCSRVSEGCRNCYAERQANRRKGPGGAYEGLVHLVNGHPTWTGKVELVENHLLDPLQWKAGVGRPRRIFVNSMSDLFHEIVPDEWIDRIFAVMALCPQHIFQVLTKRPQRMQRYLTASAAHGRSRAFLQMLHLYGHRNWVPSLLWGRCPKTLEIPEWPLPNVWLGASVENQKAADERIPPLYQTPAAVRFLSCEPLLGPITFRPRCETLDDKLRAMENGYASEPMELVGIHWVIAGGESGPGARSMHPDWARSLRDQCQRAGVPFFFKQWGEWVPTTDPKVAAARGLALNDCMSHVGKKAAGAKLDGREWREFPEAR